MKINKIYNILFKNGFLNKLLIQVAKYINNFLAQL